jgi:effector-binding domain-containing protein
MRTAHVEVIDLSPQPVAVVRARVAAEGIPEFLGAAFGEVVQALGEQHRSPAGPPFARYWPTGGGFDVEAGFPADGTVAATGRVSASTLPGGPTATTVHRGSYAEVAQTYQAVADWLAAHGYEATDAPWESYLDEPDVAEPRTLVAFPCRRA